MRYAAGAAGLVALVAAAFLLDLGRPHLWDPGESRYAEAAREMLLTGNWIVPTLNLAHYYDKPPGFYWLVAGAFELLGTTEWAARMPAAIAAVLTIAATVTFAWRRLGPAAALGAGAVLATTIQFVILGRSVRMDMPLTLVVSATLFYCYALWEAPPGREAGSRESATWPLYLFPALGLLLKGPIAVLLPVLVLATLTLVSGEYRRLRRLRPGPGAVVALALGIGWYVVAAAYAPEYLWSFLWHQNVGRFLTAQTGTGHAEPFWFFVWALPVTFLPWTLFLPAAGLRAARRLRRGDDLSLFLCAWVAVVLVFFSLSRAKLATYTLPAFPPLALLVASYLQRSLRAPEAARRQAFRVPGTVWVGGMLTLSLGTALGVALRYPGYGLEAAVALVLLVFPVLGAAALRTGRWRAIPALVLVAALATQMLFYRAGVTVVNEFTSLRTAAEVARGLPPTARIFAYKTRGHSFTFYDGRMVKRIRSPAAAASVLHRTKPTALLTKAKYLDAIQRHLDHPVCIWWQGPSGRVFIANVPPPQSARPAVLAPLAPRARNPLAPGAPPSC
jgi:4-amino-4-deoxy-L-arabinose transferase-like glycosyltransferase